MVKGYIETGVVAEVEYESTSGEIDIQEMYVESTKGVNSDQTKYGKIEGYDPENPDRNLIIREKTGLEIGKVLKSKRKRSYTLGEVKSVKFPREKQIYYATVYAGGNFAAPKGTSKDRLRELGRRISNPEVHDVSSVKEKGSHEEPHHF